MSDTKLTTPEAVNGAFEGQYRRRLLREMWFPIVLTVAVVGSPLLALGFTKDCAFQVWQGLLFAFVFWGFFLMAVQRDIARAKYSMVAGKLDAVLENVDAHWTWCEDTQSYVVHFSDNPHGDPEETTDADDDDDPEDTFTETKK